MEISSVNKLKYHLDLQKIDHKTEIMQQKSLKKAHSYCVYSQISGQKYGPILENYITQKFNYSKNNSKDCTGDCFKNGCNSEIKVSLGGTEHNKFNYVQIRPSHDCEIYILTAYYLNYDNVENEGELFIFKIPKEEMKKLIVSYGGYAHGTIKEHGQITLESINDTLKKKEYAIRPKYNDNCWKSLLNFRIEEDNL